MKYRPTFMLDKRRSIANGRLSFCSEGQYIYTETIVHAHSRCTKSSECIRLVGDIYRHIEPGEMALKVTQDHWQ